MYLHVKSTSLLHKGKLNKCEVKFVTRESLVLWCAGSIWEEKKEMRVRTRSGAIARNLSPNGRARLSGRFDDDSPFLGTALPVAWRRETLTTRASTRRRLIESRSTFQSR